MATATLMSTSSNIAIASSVQAAFTAGSLRKVRAAALMTRSLMVMKYQPGCSRAGDLAFSLFIRSTRASISISIDT